MMYPMSNNLSTQHSSSDEIVFPEVPDAKLGPSNLVTQGQKSEVKKRRVLAGDLKAYCWRLTASYLWLRVLLNIFGLQTILDSLEAKLSMLFVGFLSSVGVDFAPLTSLSFLTIFKLGWLLIITGVRPLQLFGFLAYVVVFPISAIFYAIAWFTKWEEEIKKDARIAREVKQEQRRRRRIVLSALFLFTWLLLYGGARTFRQILPGLIFSGAFFLFLTLRLFQQARPDSDARYFRPMLSLADSLISAAHGQMKTLSEKAKANTLTQSDLNVPRALAKWIRKTLMRLMPALHGKLGRERVAIFVLLEYMTSLLVVAASAVLFWAIAFKLAVHDLTLFESISLSLSLFLPGIPTPLEAPIPFWMSVGTAATSWILFVLYIGPASSLLPRWQDATVRGLESTYSLFRGAVLSYGSILRWIKRVEKNSPS